MGTVIQKTFSFPKTSPAPGSAVLQKVAESLNAALRASGVAIAHFTGNSHSILCVASCGESAPSVGTPLDINSGISGRCIREEKMLTSDDTAVDPRVNREACEHLGIRSLAVAPIFGNSAVVGVVEVFAAAPRFFDRNALERIARTAAEISAMPRRDASTLANPTSDITRGAASKIVEFCRPESNSGDHREERIGPVLQTHLASNSAFPWLGRIARLPSHLWSVAGFVLVVTIGVLSASWVITRPGARESSSSLLAPRSVTGSNIPNSADSINVVTAQDLVSEATAPVRIIMAKALAGNTDAQTSLGDHYASGDGVTRDRVKAAVWYIVASAHGSERATRAAVEIGRNLQPFEIAQVRFNLGTMFRDGIGTSRDLTTAYLWFSLANLAGDVRAPGAQHSLEAMMAPSEITEAHRRTEQWLDSHRARQANATAIASNKIR